MPAALLRTVVDSPATRALRRLAGRGLAQVPQRVRSHVVLRPVRHFPREASTAALIVGSTVVACDSGPTAPGEAATTTATDVSALMGGDTRVSTIPIGGRILVRRGTMSSNTRPAWPTRGSRR